MMRFVVILPALLAACVSAATPDSGAVDGERLGAAIQIGGKTLFAVQRYDWPSMIAPVSAETGKTVLVQGGTADTVVISGSPNSRDAAIAALAAFCKRPDITPAGFDTQFVYQDPALGDWWFDGFRCEG